MPVKPVTGVDPEVAWADLHTRLRAFVARRVADPESVDDLAQDILLRIHQRLGDLREGDRLDAWAYQIARNVITDHYRARGAGRETPTGEDLDLRVDRPDGDEANGGGGDEDLDRVRAEMAGCLAPMVRSLPEPYRQAIELTDLGPLTQAAAAERVGLSIPGMKARVQRGRQKLRNLFLECCLVATDGRGRPTAYQPRSGGGVCGCGRAPGTASGVTGRPTDHPSREREPLQQGCDLVRITHTTAQRWDPRSRR